MRGDFTFFERVVVWLNLARLAWRTTNDDRIRWGSAGRAEGPGGSFLTISPEDGDASTVNPIYACNPERTAFEIHVLNVDVTKPGDTARVYEEGGYGFYVVAFARPGSRRKVQRLTGGDSPPRAAIRAAAREAAEA